MEFKNGDRVIDKKTGKRGVFTEYDWACKDLAWILYDGEKKERKAWNHDLEIAKEKVNVFRWKDYEENTCLFVDGIDTNVAVLRYKDFQLTDASTGNKFKMKSSCIEEAKVDAENFLKEYWKRVQKDVNKIMDKIS